MFAYLHIIQLKILPGTFIICDFLNNSGVTGQVFYPISQVQRSRVRYRNLTDVWQIMIISVIDHVLDHV